MIVRRLNRALLVRVNLRHPLLFPPYRRRPPHRRRAHGREYQQPMATPHWRPLWRIMAACVLRCSVRWRSGGTRTPSSLRGMR